MQLIRWTLLVVLVLITSLVTQTQAQQSPFTNAGSLLSTQDDEFLKVDQAFVFNFNQQTNKLIISFDISDGYYLYRKQFKFKAQNAQLGEVKFPQGIDHEDEYFGKQQIYKNHLALTLPLAKVIDDAQVIVRYQGCADKGLCYPPQIQRIPLDKIINAVTEPSSQAVLSALASADSSVTDTQKKAQTIATNNVEQPEQYRLASMLKQDNVLLTLAAFFVGGLLLAFTPCVFPMYPILTGIIVGQGKQLSGKKAFSLSFVYVQGMALTYTLLGIVVALAGAQFQAMFQHPVVLISLSVIFILLALSMFGAFNLALPASWQQKLNGLSNQQQGGSIWGVFTMGVISGLVASPCTTAPLTGALLYISQSGDLVLGGFALYALSLGMGLPLLLLGASGGKLLPKAGAWMNVIKHTFGFLLLAVPLFLLQRIVPAQVNELLWASLLLAAMSYYWVINNQSQNKGFWYGARHLMVFIGLFLGAMQLYQLVFPSNSVVKNSIQQGQQSFVKVANYQALMQTVQQANAQGKTVMVDLYADWCIACKEFEHYTFFEPQVQQALANTVMVQIDLTDTNSPAGQEIMNKFEVLGLPTILFFDLQGNELNQRRVTGFMNADEFTKHIKLTF